VIDLHCHLLPGLDDGPATLEDAVAMAEAAVDAGTELIVATPHVSFDYHNDAQRIRFAAQTLSARLHAMGIALDIRVGAEIALGRLLDIEDDELARLTLAGTSWLLIEPPFSAVIAGIDTFLEQVQQLGYRILLAHPERCPAFHRDRSLLERVVDAGAFTSVTAASLTGGFGKAVQRFSFDLLHAGLVHNIASDAHDIDRRPPGIGEALGAEPVRPLATWLTESVPRAIVDDATIPPQPPVSREGNRSHRRRRG
jgi:protein-tyrosine phosphatase